jgi:hypothetical protein
MSKVVHRPVVGLDLSETSIRDANAHLGGSIDAIFVPVKGCHHAERIVSKCGIPTTVVDPSLTEGEWRAVGRWGEPDEHWFENPPY